MARTDRVTARRTSRLALLALVVAIGPGSLAGESPAGDPVTFNREIAPIVFENCAPCHRPGEVAPFPLLTYRDVKRRARQIAEVTETRYMPPWLPMPGHGEFRDPRRLSDGEIAWIGQ